MEKEILAMPVANPLGNGIRYGHRVRLYRRCRIRLRKARRFITGLAFCLFGSVSVQAASSADMVSCADTASIYMTGKVKDNAVWLRWAASGSGLWEMALQRGWLLERYAFDSAALATPSEDAAGSLYRPERTLFRIPPFRASDTAHLAAMSDTCPYAAVLGEVVFSPDFSLTFGGRPASSPWSGLAQDIQRKEARFVLANLAYDRSFPVARIGGMGYVDTTIVPGYFYLYRVSVDSLFPGNDTALFFTRQEKGSPLPPIQELKTDFGDRIVRLAWDVRLLQTVSTGYYVERSLESKRGKTEYIRLNRTPLTALQEHASGTMSYSDSLPDNERKYVYRILGTDLFGHEFPVARSRSGQGKRLLDDVARIDSIRPAPRGKLRLFWTYPEDREDRLESFSLYVTSAPQWKEEEAILLVSGISTRSRSCLFDPNLLSESSYFYIRTVGYHRERFLSLPYFYRRKDSIPPLAPSGLFAEVDSLCTVRLGWSSSKEADLAGYRVFWRVEKEGVPVQLTSVLLTDTVFVDTLSLHTARHFYYSVAAEDKTGNLSPHSALLAVKNRLPDKLVPALFSRQSREEKDRVILSWYNSQSSGVQGHLLLYKIDSSSWIPLKDFPKAQGREMPATSEYIFRYPSRQLVTNYTFTVMAYGENRQTDTAYSPYPYRSLYLPLLKAPRPVAFVDRDNRYVQLQWKSPAKEEYKRLYLYRRAKDEPLRLLATLGNPEASREFYPDFSVRMNTEYEYFIQIEYADGRWSAYSEPCAVVY